MFSSTVSITCENVEAQFTDDIIFRKPGEKFTIILAPFPSVLIRIIVSKLFLVFTMTLDSPNYHKKKRKTNYFIYLEKFAFLGGKI